MPWKVWKKTTNFVLKSLENHSQISVRTLIQGHQLWCQLVACIATSY